MPCAPVPFAHSGDALDPVNDLDGLSGAEVITMAVPARSIEGEPCFSTPVPRSIMLVSRYGWQPPLEHLVSTNVSDNADTSIGFPCADVLAS